MNTRWNMLDKRAVVDILRDAFLPLECVPEMTDYENAFGFRVYGPDGASVFEKPIVSTGGLLRERCELESYIRHWRERIEAKGFRLDPWSMPASDPD